MALGIASKHSIHAGLRSAGCAVAAASVLAFTPVARADASPADKAAAEALFEHAKGLMKEGKYAAACPKFAESLRLDGGIGITLYLADCYQKVGKTASAWAEFRDAAAQAKLAGQTDREKKARERAVALEPLLNRVSIALEPGADVPGIEVKRNGGLIPQALWGTPIPLDPGDHAIEVTAPGKQTWTFLLHVGGAQVAAMSVVVPVLKNLPPPPERTVEPKKVEPPKVEPPRSEPPRVDPPKVEPPKADKPKAAPQKPRDDPFAQRRESSNHDVEPRGTSPARVLGYTAMGLGLGGGAAGGVLGALALLKNSNAASNCRPNDACNPAGVDARNAALGLAQASDITLAAAGGTLVTGIVLLLVARPSSQDRPSYSFHVTPMIGGGTSGLTAVGVF